MSWGELSSDGANTLEYGDGDGLDPSWWRVSFLPGGYHTLDPEVDVSRRIGARISFTHGEVRLCNTP